MFRPYVPANAALPEFSVRAVLLGTLLGVIFGASSLYLVLKVGLTVSASIPVAVISITVFRLLGRIGFKDASILENNIVQTAGSAGESLAFGLGVTMPAAISLGFDLEWTRLLLVALMGGLLGILMMIPLRRALIVQQHGRLAYPEGTACAEVLKAGASAESRHAVGLLADGEYALNGRTIVLGFVVGLLYKIGNVALKGWKDVPEKLLGPALPGGSLAIEVSPELLGVGYIIGPRIAAVMCAGGVLTYLVLIPMIRFFGEGLDHAIAPASHLIRDMGPAQIRSGYVLYIGAGAVAAGGLISMVRALPLIWQGLQRGLTDYRASASDLAEDRTHQDLPLKWVGIGIIVLLTVITWVPALHMNVLGALLIVLFGFLFVTVSSRLTGEIGSSSNPVSGMTVATLLLTCLIFLALGWTGPSHYVTALSVGAIVCIASSNGGTTSQDLKTGYLLGATPRLQQQAILIGSLASALALGPILLKMNEASTVYVPAAEVASGLRTDVRSLHDTAVIKGPQAAADGRTFHVWHKRGHEGGPEGQYLVNDDGSAAYFVDPGINGNHTIRPDGSVVRKFEAPKATLMSYIIKGILDRQLPWALVLMGVAIAVVLELAGIPSLPFAVGVYLPLSASAPILVGGTVRWLVDRRRIRQISHLSEVEQTAAADSSPGVLLSSGYIAGGAIAGIFIAFTAGVVPSIDALLNDWALKHNALFNGPAADALSLLPFLGLCALLWYVAYVKPSDR